MNEYYPIEADVEAVAEAEASRPGNECHKAATSHEVTRVGVSRSEPHYWTPFEETSFRLAPVDGSFSSVKQSGAIKMTAMSVGSSKKWSYLGSVNRTIGTSAFAIIGDGTRKVGSKCVNCYVRDVYHDHSFATAQYTEKGDFAYWRSRYPGFPHFKMDPKFDPSEIEAVKASAYQELFQAYNLGEEIVELRSTVRMMVDLLTKAYRFILDDAFQKKVLRNSNHKDALDAWLTYRYGLMPIYYSVRDLIDLLAMEGKYRTVRKRVRPAHQPVLSPTENCFYDTGSVDHSIRVTVKGRWSSNESKVRDLINVNPFTTAAAVYPWALVVRWFINVNSYLDAKVKSLTTLSEQHIGCVATRLSKETQTHMRLNEVRTMTVYHNGDSSSCGPKWFRPYGPYHEEMRDTADVVLAKESTQTYVRELFFPTDVKLVWNPTITLSRAIDAMGFLIGTLKPLSKGVTR